MRSLRRGTTWSIAAHLLVLLRIVRSILVRYRRRCSLTGGARYLGGLLPLQLLRREVLLQRAAQHGRARDPPHALGAEQRGQHRLARHAWSGSGLGLGVR